MRILIPVSDGVNATELVTILELLCRVPETIARMDLAVSYVGDSDYAFGIKSSTHAKFVPDGPLTEAVASEDWDAIVIPGGRMSAECLMKSALVLRLVQQQFHENHLVAAICSSTVVLAVAGILKRGEKVTGFHDAQSRLENDFGLIWVDKPVVKAGNVLTARGPGASIPFAFAIIEHFFGRDILRTIDERFVSKSTLEGLKEIESLLWH